jgi:hypothetical protein
MRDSDVRAALRDKLHALHAGDADTRLVEEMGIWSGSVRIDMAVINGELAGFELKSDRDTLQRLPNQADLYGRVFDRLTLVVGSRHMDKAMAVIPPWWGVTAAALIDGRVALTDVRAPMPNPSPDPYLVAQLLWKEEAVGALEAFGLAVGWRSKRVKLIHQRLAAEVPFADLALHVRSALKVRNKWLGQSGPDHLDVSVHA